MFAKKFLHQNARQIKNLSQNVLWFWYSVQNKARPWAKTVEGAPNIHSVWTMILVRIIQVRNRSYLCIFCKNNQEYVINVPNTFQHCLKVLKTMEYNFKHISCISKQSPYYIPYCLFIALKKIVCFWYIFLYFYKQTCKTNKKFSC